MAYINDISIRHIPKFGGEIWFVNAAIGTSGVGTSPDTAFQTIGEAITAMAAGDAITVRAGTYTETGLDLSKDSTEIWFESGAVIDTTAETDETSLTISGDYCVVKGTHVIKPDANGSAIGMVITGIEARISDGKIVAGGTGVQISAAATGATFYDYVAGLQTTTSWDIGGAQGRFFECGTVGIGASYGFKIGAVAAGILRNCTSSGHTTSGFYLGTGATGWTLISCSSGGGDGKWRDIDDVNVWSGFAYPETKYKEVTFITTGAQTYNLFRVYGSVLIDAISAHIETAICVNMTAFHLEIDDGTAQVDVTKNDGVISSLPVGSYLVKDDKSGETIAIVSAAAGALQDEWDAKKAAFSVTEKNVAGSPVATYIRLSCTSTTDPPTGELHFHVEWKPLTDAGFLEPA